ncbi:MAG: GIY-YIG nuclease family protein [Candidatus Omnitrophica bacterium]|nr:GIY-YIG nuclease family protein [Candidatus Omnitrophota bacterium]MDD5611314.1 GIY-YIG nuclease family protein [Candidatus Omnitrophota bacterium]
MKKDKCVQGWQVYIIECSDSVFYTGITNNLKRRVSAHNSGNGCRFTRCRAPVKLRYSEFQPDRSQALKREAQIKKFPRLKKLALIKQSRRKLAAGIK